MRIPFERVFSSCVLEKTKFPDCSCCLHFLTLSDSVECIQEYPNYRKGILSGRRVIRPDVSIELWVESRRRGVSLLLKPL